MDIAAMNERILIQKSTVVTDRIGNRTNGWSDFYSCFATISDSTGKSNAEESVAGLVVDTSDINFTVRFCQSGNGGEHHGIPHYLAGRDLQHSENRPPEHEKTRLEVPV